MPYLLYTRRLRPSYHREKLEPPELLTALTQAARPLASQVQIRIARCPGNVLLPSLDRPWGAFTSLFGYCVPRLILLHW